MDPERSSQAWADARQRWPALTLSQEAFASEVTAFDVDPGASDTALADLVLACACLLGDRAAMACFERDVMAGVAAAVRRVDGRDDQIDEVRQALRTRLFVGERPKILDYRASGPLASWVKVAAIRLAVDEGRREQTRANVADALTRRFVEASADDPDLVVLRRDQHAAFSSALRAACGELEARDRTILKMQFLDGLGIDRIAAAYGIHRSSAARWVHRACRALEQRVAERLGSATLLGPSEVRSLGRVLQSQLSVSFEGLRVTQ